MADLETSKIRSKALKFCVGLGIDIGCSSDKIKPDATGFDRNPGDGVDVIGDAAAPLKFPDVWFDYVYSSHCLEDLEYTESALREWLRVLKKDGHIILYIPHADHYKGCNLDHRVEFRNKDIVLMLTKLGCRIIVDEVDAGPNRYSMFIVGKKI